MFVLCLLLLFIIPAASANNTTDIEVDTTFDNELQNVNSSIVEDNYEGEQAVLSVPDVDMYYHDGTKLVINLSDANGNPLANKSVSVLINGVNMVRNTAENGTIAISINLESNIYNITTCYKEDNITVNSIVNVKSTIESYDIVKIFRNQTQFHVTFVDNVGNLINNADVRFNINGVFYTKKTNKSGVATLNINLNPGTYIITTTNPITGEQKGNNITVKPNIVDNKNLIKYFRNDSQYHVKILDGMGNTVGSGVNVTFNINGVFYTRTTNASGIATLAINLNPGNYIITAIYNECMVSNNISVLQTILSYDGNITQGHCFYVTTLDNQGKILPNQNVTFNINGVFYEKISNDKGIAKLTINLNLGEYIITSEYNGCFVSNIIVVNKSQIHPNPGDNSHASSSISAPNFNLKDLVQDGYYAGTPVYDGNYYHVPIYDENGTLVDSVIINPYNGEVLGRG